MLRPLAGTDAARVVQLAQDPSVARWWPRVDDAEVAGWLAASDYETFVIEDGDEVIGVLQVSEEPDADYRHAGLDIFVAADRQGQGVGPDALRTMIRHLFADRGHHRVTIDPRAENDNAIRAYERVGFRPVGVMRRYERRGDGTWADGLLMDLLEGELA